MKIKEMVLNNLKKVSFEEWILSASLILSGIVLAVIDNAGLIDELLDGKNNNDISDQKTVYQLPAGYTLEGTKGVKYTREVKPASYMVDPITGDKTYFGPTGYKLDGTMLYKDTKEVIEPVKFVVTHK